MNIYFQKLRYLYWRKGFVSQHNPQTVSKMLDGVFDYKQVKYGDIKNKQGDLVIINLGKNKDVSVEEYLGYFLGVEKVEQNGIYTNVFFNKQFFFETIKEISGYGKTDLWLSAKICLKILAWLIKWMLLTRDKIFATIKIWYQ